jgi:hypothetical protein
MSKVRFEVKPALWRGDLIGRIALPLVMDHRPTPDLDYGTPSSPKGSMNRPHETAFEE